jgi:hypothetical protein
MMKRNLARHLERLEAELTPSSDNEQVLTITVERIGGPTRIIELRGIKPQSRHSWPSRGTQ